MEYNLIHDPSKREPDIEVNSKKVAVDTWLCWANMTHDMTYHALVSIWLATSSCRNLYKFEHLRKTS